MSKNKKGKEDDNSKKLPTKKSDSVIPVLAKSDQAKIEELLKTAFQEYSLKYDAKKLERAETAQSVSALVSEFLSAFIVIGYDMSGRPLNLIHATNQMDADALSSALNKFIFNLNSMDE